MKKVQSTCNYCALACNIDFHVEDNKIIKVVPTKNLHTNLIAFIYFVWNKFKEVV